MILLASASPRRQQLLQQIGVQFTVAAQNVDEAVKPGEDPRSYVERISTAKASAATPQLNSGPCRVVLAADTAVVCDNQIMGKPEDEYAAVAMLLTLSNREHRVLTAITVSDDAESRSSVSESRVRFRAISREEACAYWQTGEPRGKAGGYAIQGLAAIFVSELHGSYSGVMGLPLYETASLLEQFHIPCLPLK